MKKLKASGDGKTLLLFTYLLYRMAIGLTFLGVFCMWLMWISVYMHQMYPLINPILDKEIIENAER